MESDKQLDLKDQTGSKLVPRELLTGKPSRTDILEELVGEVSVLPIIAFLEAKAFKRMRLVIDYTGKGDEKRRVTEYSDGKVLTVHFIEDNGMTLGIYRKLGKNQYSPVIEPNRALLEVPVFTEIWNGIDDKAFFLRERKTNKK